MASVSSKYHLSALLMVRFSGTRTCHWGEGGARGTSLGRQRGRAPQGARSLTSPTNPRLADRFVVRRTPNCCYPPNAGTGLRVLGGLCARLAGWRLRCPRDSLPCLLPAHGHRDCARTYARTGHGGFSNDVSPFSPSPHPGIKHPPFMGLSVCLSIWEHSLGTRFGLCRVLGVEQSPVPQSGGGAET